MSNTFRWGIIGAGRIVHRWIPALQHLPDTCLTSICSTSMEKAQGVAQQYSPGAKCFDNVDEFVRSGIDAAYIATAHPYHLHMAVKCLEAGIPVLCEKPITPNAGQCRELVAVARKSGIFLMEGFWTRFFPATCQVLEWLKAGEIGEIVRMQGSFATGPLKYAPTDRLFSPDDAGGSLLDVGVYPIQCAAIYAGEMPAEALSFARMGPSGVDHSADVLLRFPGGATASLYASFETQAEHSFTILGTRGRIEIRHPFWRPKSALLLNDRGEVAYQDPDNPGVEGFYHEILHVQECVAQGLGESPWMPLSHSLQIMELCDILRSQWGLRYPFE